MFEPNKHMHFGTPADLSTALIPLSVPIDSGMDPLINIYYLCLFRFQPVKIVKDRLKIRETLSLC